MKLTDLLKGLPHLRKEAFQEKEIQQIAFDSRRAGPKSLFVCIRGEKEDGHAYAKDAAERGAVAFVCEKRLPLAAPQILVPDTRLALSALCHNFFEAPSKSLQVLGITGTNGKTTTVSLTSQLLNTCGLKTCFFSTVESQIGSETFSTQLTTEDPWTLHHLLARARRAKMEMAVIEVSSHAIAQKRVAHITFRGAGLTNITRDHLDFHKTMKHYAETKISLFRSLPKDAFASANSDDPWQRKYVDAFPKKTFWYGRSKDAALSLSQIQVHQNGFRATLRTPYGPWRITSPLRGRFQAHNLLCALALVFRYTDDLPRLAKAISQAKPVAGRMEPVELGQPFSCLVDYAHTPDALAKVLQAAREWTSGRLLVLFGCGGDRDRGKRPKMAAAAEAFSDRCILTSDNPRSEDPRKILSEIQKGFKKKDQVLIEPDRHQAIALALKLCQPGDTLLIAGKGHETVQILGNQRIHFDDREVAEEELKKMGFGKKKRQKRRG